MEDGGLSANGYTSFGGDGNGAPRVTTEKFSLSLGGAVRKHGATLHQHQPAKRLRKSLLGEHEDDLKQQQHEQISSFGQILGSGRTMVSAPSQNAKVIQSIPNRDWREESRRQKQRQSQSDPNGLTAKENPVFEAAEESTPKFGLTIVDRDSRGPKNKSIQPAVAEPTPSATNRDNNGGRKSSPQASSEVADEEALAALLGQRPHADKAVITPAAASEEEVFRESYASAPRNCTLEEYQATPVEGYGAAILRGYLKEGQTLEDRFANGTPAKERSGFIPERRPGLLGLGAKESGLGVELGAWGKGAGGGGGKKNVFGQSDASSYNPLARKSKKTGEIISEEGLNQALQSQRQSSTNTRTYKGGEQTARASQTGDIDDSNLYRDLNSVQQSDSSERQKRYEEGRELSHRKERYREMDGRSAHGRRPREYDSHDSDRHRRSREDRNRDDKAYEVSRRTRPKDKGNNASGMDWPRYRERSSETAKNNRSSGRR